MFLRNWFPASMLQAGGSEVDAFRRTLLTTSREGVAGSWAALRDADLRRSLRLVDRPTLVIAGAHDTVTSVHHGEEIAATVPGARLAILPAVHLSNVERPQAFLDLVVAFLTEVRDESTTAVEAEAAS